LFMKCKNSAVSLHRYPHEKNWQKEEWMQYTVYLVLAPIAGVVSIASTIIAWRGRKVSGFISLIWLLICVTGFLVFNLLEFLTPTESATFFWARAAYLFVTFLPIFWIAFTLEYTGHLFWLKPSRFWVLCLIPLVTLICALYDPLLPLMWREYTFVNAGGSFLVLKVLHYGSWFWVFTFYSYLLVLGGALLVVLSYFRSNRLYQRQSLWVTIGAVTPLVGNIIYLSRIIPGLTKDFSPVSYTLAGVCFTVGIFRYQLLDLMPVARATLVDEMGDGVIVLDHDERIVDINPAAKTMFTLPANAGVGKPINLILPHWNEWARELDNRDSPQNTVEIMNEVNGLAHSYELRLSKLADSRGNPHGRLVMLRDVTERKEDEAALRQAHAELEQRVIERTAELAALNKTLEQRVTARTRELSALYEVSAVASQASDLEKLMAKTLERTMSVIPSRLGAIYLLDEHVDTAVSIGLQLVVQRGSAVDFAPAISSLPGQNGLLDRVISHRAPLLIANTIDDPQIVAILRQPGPLAMLVAPMFAEKYLLGVLLLGNTMEQGFQPEDVALLSSIADQISLAAQSNRLRRQTILYEERQRLARDLHDSVTQSLYGLVTLTEAGQAQLESGAAENIAHTLARIGQTARQALKEMRLYIYQLRPPDVDEEGLVGALQLRLTAVEGRSNIKVRLVVDDELGQLSAEVTNAFYHITQEALNNVLKHTLATSVTVYLRRSEEAVTLEVVDNGLGFNPQKAINQGMGLTNMRERARKAGCAFEISSVLSQGTSVKVTAPQKG
jgi:PAS domain S-box-containing protein